MDYSWHLWLYERLKMYIECACVNLDFHKFKYKGEEYSQEQLINMMLERLEFSFSPKYNDFDNEQYNYVHEIEEIWAKVVGAMWW